MASLIHSKGAKGETYSIQGKGRSGGVQLEIGGAGQRMAVRIINTIPQDKARPHFPSPDRILHDKIDVAFLAHIELAAANPLYGDPWRLWT
jgi:hypothetical protein